MLTILPMKKMFVVSLVAIFAASYFADVSVQPAQAATNAQIAYIDASPFDGAFSAFTFDGTNWTQNGNSQTVFPMGYIAITALNATDVAYFDSFDSLYTYRFDGTNWSQVGNGLLIGSFDFPALAALNGTDVALSGDGASQLATYRFDGTNWSQVGNGLALGGVFVRDIAALNSTDVAFVDDGNDELRTYRFDGTNWSQVGNSLPIAGGTNPRIAEYNGTDIAYIDDANDDLRIYRFDGTNWSQVGNDLNIPGTLGFTGLTYLGNGNFAFSDEIVDDLRTYHFDGTNWSQVGNTLSTAGNGAPALATLQLASAPDPDPEPDQPEPQVPTISIGRISGTTPTQQSIEISRERFPVTGTAPIGLIARNDVVADSLTISPLVNRTGGTLLVNDRNTLLPEILTELNRAVGPGHAVYLAGGEQAQSLTIVEQLRAAGYSVIRLGDSNRRGTAVKIAEEIVRNNPAPTTTVFVTDDRLFADSLAAGGVAGRLDGVGNVAPVLLNPRGSDALDPFVRSFLDANPQVTNLELVGGSNALGPGLENTIKTRYSYLTDIFRVVGTNRFDTNVKLVTHHLGHNITKAIIVNGESSGLPGATLAASQSGFFNALLGGPLAAKDSAALLLTRATALPSETIAYLESTRATLKTIKILGDTSQISQAVENQLNELF
jgi:putative cell wall-binding protein